MSTFDIILLVLLGLGAVQGFRHGFIVELFSFLAFFIGLFLALEFTIPVSIRLFGTSDYFDLGAIAIFFVLFAILTFAIKAAAKAIKNMIDVTLFGTVDSFIGALAGAIKLAFIVSVAVWVLDSVGLSVAMEYGNQSLVFPYIVNVGPAIFEGVSYVLPFMKDLIDSMDEISLPNGTVLT